MRLTLGVTAALLLAGGVAVSGQDLPESSPRALMHHAQGIEAYVAEKYADAIAHFRMAWESDPTSYVSLLMAGVAAGNAGQGALADSLYAAVAPHKDKLSPYYRYRLQAQMAGRAGDVAGVVEFNRQAAELGDGTKAWYNIAQAGGSRGQASEALAALRKLDPDKEPMKGWYSYYSVYGTAAHVLGEHEDELAMARRARAAFPNDLRAMQREVIALAALGRTADAEAVLTTARAMPIGPGTNYGDISTLYGLELAAHGKAAEGRKWLQAALQWFESLPTEVANMPSVRGGRGYALYSLGRYNDLPSIYASLMADQPNAVAWKAWSGIAAGLNRDKAKAMEISNAIASNQIATGTNRLAWRALIATSLRDRTAALAFLNEWGLKPEWLHRDPEMTKLLGPALGEYLTQK